MFAFALLPMFTLSKLDIRISHTAHTLGFGGWILQPCFASWFNLALDYKNEPTWIPFGSLWLSGERGDVTSGKSLFQIFGAKQVHIIIAV